MRDLSAGLNLPCRAPRVVIAGDSSVVVEAITIGFRRSSEEFEMVGRTDGRSVSAGAILSAEPDAVLLDDMDGSERAVYLIRELRTMDAGVALIVLSIRTDASWLEILFGAGATAVISKATKAVVVTTLVRETLRGHIFHRCHDLPTARHVPTELMAALALTEREFEVLQLVAAGATNAEVARRLWVTEQTVKFHLRNVFRKLRVTNRTEASHFAHLNGLVSGVELDGGTRADFRAVSV